MQKLGYSESSITVRRVATPACLHQGRTPDYPGSAPSLENGRGDATCGRHLWPQQGEVRRITRPRYVVTRPLALQKQYQHSRHAVAGFKLYSLKKKNSLTHTHAVNFSDDDVESDLTCLHRLHTLSHQVRFVLYACCMLHVAISLLVFIHAYTIRNSPIKIQKKSAVDTCRLTHTYPHTYFQTVSSSGWL